MEDRGLEPLTKPSGKTPNSALGDAESGAVDATNVPSLAELQSLIETCSDLSHDAKSDILTIIQAE